MAQGGLSNSFTVLWPRGCVPYSHLQLKVARLECGESLLILGTACGHSCDVAGEQAVALSRAYESHAFTGCCRTCSGSYVRYYHVSVMPQETCVRKCWHCVCFEAVLKIRFICYGQNCSQGRKLLKSCIQNEKLSSSEQLLENIQLLAYCPTHNSYLINI